MAKVRLTKAFVVRTLRRETRFVKRTVLSPAFTPGVKVTDPECTMCAVGTLIAGSLAESTQVALARRNVVDQMAIGVDWVYGGIVRATAALRSGEPLRALSLVFESGRDAQHGAERAIALAESDAFPSHVEIDIDGLRPRKARGLTVVRKTKRRA